MIEADDRMVCVLGAVKLVYAVFDLQLVDRLRLKESTPAGAHVRTRTCRIEHAHARAPLFAVVGIVIGLGVHPDATLESPSPAEIRADIPVGGGLESVWPWRHRASAFGRRRTRERKIRLRAQCARVV